MNTRNTFTPRPTPLPRCGAAVLQLIQTFSLLLLAQFSVFPASATGGQPTISVKLDGKTVFIPEVKLTSRITPVTTVLHIGSWQNNPKAKVDQKLLWTLDSQSGGIIIESPENLLENSKPIVRSPGNIGTFMDGIAWGKNNTTHVAFKIMASRRQPVVIELYTDSDAVLFNNGNVSSKVSASDAVASGGRGYMPLMLEVGENIVDIKQCSQGEPRIQPTIYLDHSHDLHAAWQTQGGGLLNRLVYMTKGRASVPELGWNPYLGNFSVSMEVRNVSTNEIIFRRESARRGRIFSDENQGFAPGIYEAVYRTKNDSASEFFVVGNPQDIFEELQGKLSKYSPDSESKLDIEAQLRRAQILLAKDNFNFFDRQWQEKAAYTFSCLATIERRLKEGATNIAKDQPGLHIRGFTSNADSSFQSYRLFIPSSYNPGTPLPLLVIASASVVNTERSFIEGPVMANHREALLWAKYAEKHGFALLWPGYRGAPKGFFTFLCG